MCRSSSPLTPLLTEEPALDLIEGFCILQKNAADVSTNFLSSQFDLLEMDRLERPLVNLPLLLDPSSYVPDTVDLTDDALARKYWLSCFEEALDGVRARWAGGRPRSGGGWFGNCLWPPWVPRGKGEAW